MSWNSLGLPLRAAPRVRRPSWRPRLEVLEDRLTPAVSVPSGFANVAIVNSGLNSPTTLEALPDGRLLVGLQNGAIHVIQNDALVSQPAINLANVESGGERGLLGITYDPNFASNRFIYVFYTANANADPSFRVNHNRISRLTLNGNVAGNEQVLWRLPQVGSVNFHMGGALHFGIDGKLYVGVGEHEDSPAAQSLSSQFGKILRLDVSTTPATIPTDNPFFNTASGDNRAIWALGLRNPYTAAIQPGTGLFYINDVGAAQWEEINQVTKGANYGWSTTEGPFNASQHPNFTNPAYAYDHSEGCAITGGDFYNPQSATFPGQYVGKYFYQDFCGGFIKTLDPATKQVGNFATGLNFPVDLRVAANGAIYYITRGAQTGGQPATGGVGKIVYTVAQTPVITGQPTANQTVPAGEPATLSVTASSPSTLSYRWQKLVGSTWTNLNNGGSITGATSATLTISPTATADSGRYRVVVTNSAGSTTSNESVLTVTSNHRPTVTIDAPAANSTYRGGSVISYSGSATDPEEGAIASGSRYTWQVDFHHDAHAHPFIAPTTGSTSGSFTIPTTGHSEGNTWYRIYLTVTDAQGLSASTFRDIIPQTSQVTVNSNVAGVQVSFQGQPKNLPNTVTGTIATELTLDAPLSQAVNGVTYAFAGWADNAGAPASRTVVFPQASATYTVNYVVSQSVFVSDLAYTVTANGWGPVEKDRSNGENAAGDGKAITLGGTTYAKGLGVHASSDLTVALGGKYATFQADIGVDDEVGNNGSVIFQVWADGAKLYESPPLTGASATVPVSVNVAGKNQLRLVVTSGSTSDISYDHADWASARLLASQAPSSTATAFVSDLPYTVTANGWGPVEKDRSNGQNAAGDGKTITLAGQTYAKGLGVHANSDLTVALGGKYGTFQADIGVDDEVGNNGSVIFQVWADGVKLYESPQLTGASATVPVTVNVAGKNQLRLVVTSGSTSDISYDHADWANARLSSTVVYVSDLPYTVTANGWGPVEKDRSNGQNAAGDGKPITLAGKTYAKGLGVHANSDLSVALNGQYKTFEVDIGVDDEVGNNGSVIFQVWVDGVKIYESPELTGSSATVPLKLNVAGKNSLRLVVTSGLNGDISYDHADWADARLTS